MASTNNHDDATDVDHVEHSAGTYDSAKEHNEPSAESVAI